MAEGDGEGTGRRYSFGDMEKWRRRLGTRAEGREGKVAMEDEWRMREGGRVG